MPFDRGVLNSLAVEFARIGVDWIGSVANYRLTSVDGGHHVSQGRVRRIRRFRNHFKLERIILY